MFWWFGAYSSCGTNVLQMKPCQYVWRNAWRNQCRCMWVNARASDSWILVSMLRQISRTITVSTLQPALQIDRVRLFALNRIARTCTNLQNLPIYLCKMDLCKCKYTLLNFQLGKIKLLGGFTWECNARLWSTERLSPITPGSPNWFQKLFL